jgi:hypothetical protein
MKQLRQIIIIEYLNPKIEIHTDEDTIVKGIMESIILKILWYGGPPWVLCAVLLFIIFQLWKKFQKVQEERINETKETYKLYHELAKDYDKTFKSLLKCLRLKEETFDED